jgi:acyl dehydratase
MLFCTGFLLLASTSPELEIGEMLYNAGTLLPEHRVKASIEPIDFYNRIQDDEYARHYGFRAGLVSGVTIFAYMSRPLAESLGKDWLERGSADVRFVSPVYSGEEIRINGSVASVTKEGIRIECQAANNQGTGCGIGIAQLAPSVPAVEPVLEDYPAGKARLHRPISLESLEPGQNLVPVSSDFTWSLHWQYCRKSIRDLLPLYEKTMHPGWLLSRASQVLATNFAVQAWIDVSCRIQHFHLQDEECAIQTRGRVQNRFEREGNHFIELDLGVFAETRCLAVIHYTAIFRIAPKAA